MPSTKPDLKFDDEGVCSACRAYEDRKHVDWDERKVELETTLDRSAETEATGIASCPSVVVKTAPIK